MGIASEVTSFSRASSGTSRLWPRAVVFDCDGLLVDTTVAWHGAYRAVAHANGASLDDDTLSSLHGVDAATAAGRLAALLRRPVAPSDIAALLLDQLRSLSIAPCLGADALTALLARHFPLAIASNAPTVAATLALGRVGLAERFELIVGADAVAAPKPAPDAYRAACAGLGVDPADAVAFEDSATGSAAAHAAGMLVIGVPSRRGEVLAADLVVSTLADPRVLALLLGNRAAAP